MGNLKPHKARKRFGQNFLHDQGVIQAILSAISASSDDHLVEIGPGQGALTEPLLQDCKRLDVVELDRDLVQLLERKFSAQPKLSIHSADALFFDFGKLSENGEKLRVIGNLPYNISTPLMFHLLEGRAVIKDMHFMLQKEVVDRMQAQPGNKHYGKLSIMLQYHCHVEKLFDVPPECFDPAPKVVSAIVRLIPHHEPPIKTENPALLSRVVTQAFSQRRKTLRNSLSGLFSAEQLIAHEIDPTLRAENLSIEKFVKLSNVLNQRK
ncbi:MAG: 16S rRNA (adenine(1518)-N(6)/adenine(1519)-N(6))-dimethyltransferase [Gammaproteobacteria bacterium]|nr:MAG: 16S rRNA (adenine(1518)-N(6)/adenine(1519)-N(6))-dimethyltransferase [Gammaproteobacteria bacterium]RLA20305.1 MAG: 16S rRNA (adenine(1518)-N(6)/adenine(1519)-N(6))-dimethyltransferase [Gammaproteobacteria bacterium]